MAAVFKPEEPSPPLTPEREAARQLLTDDERKMLEVIERDLARPLTEEEEHLVLEPGALIEQPSPKISSPMRPSGGRGSRQNEARRNMLVQIMVRRHSVRSAFTQGLAQRPTRDMTPATATLKAIAK